MSNLQVLLNVLVVVYIIVKERALILKAVSVAAHGIVVGTTFAVGVIVSGAIGLAGLVTSFVSNIINNTNDFLCARKELKREKRINKFINEFSKEEILDAYESNTESYDEEFEQRCFDIAQGKVNTDNFFNSAEKEVAASVDVESVYENKKLTLLTLVVNGKVFSFTDVTGKTVVANFLKDKDGFDCKFSDFGGDDDFMTNVEFLRSLDPEVLPYDYKGEWSTGFHNTNRKRKAAGMDKFSIDNAEVLMLTIMSSDIKNYKVFEAEVIVEEEDEVLRMCMEQEREVAATLERVDQTLDAVKGRQLETAINMVIKTAKVYDPQCIEDILRMGFCSAEQYDKFLKGIEASEIIERAKNANIDINYTTVMALVGGVK